MGGQKVTSAVQYFNIYLREERGQLYEYREEFEN